MRRSIFIGCLFTAGLLLSAFAVLGYVLLRQTIPDYNEILSLPSLRDTVRIIRDPAGIPFIHAQFESDAFFALGYLHAQDRLWQMDLFRRFGQGRLSEIFGPDFLPVDYTMRLLQLQVLADTLRQHTDPHALAILESYVKGINAFIQKHIPPLEFALLDYTPAPWTVNDCLLLARLMGWELNLSYWSDLAFALIADTLGPERALQLFPPLPNRPFPTITDTPLHLFPLDTIKGRQQQSFQSSQTSIDIPHFRSFTKLFQRWQQIIPNRSSGSNSWAIRSDRHLFLSSDPHLTYFLPPRWYAVQILTPSLHVAGMTIPGLPFPVVGRNASIAWGMTNMMADDCDFFIEKLDSTRKRYFIDSIRTVPLQFVVDTIHIRNHDPLIIHIARTRNGPIINAHHLFQALQQFTDSVPSSFPYLHRTMLSLRWSGFIPTDEVGSFYRILKATNWKEFKRALRSYGTPALYFTYADTAGNIGILPAGLLPQRAGATFLPRRGWNPEDQWQGFIHTLQLPHQFNPQRSFVFSANNPLSPDLNNGFLWEPLSRAQRIDTLLSRLTHLSLSDMKLMHLDFVSPYAQQLCRLITESLDTNRLSLQLQRWIRKLRQWNGILHPSSATAAFYSILRLELTKQILHDELQDIFALYCFTQSLPTRLLPILLTDSTYQWWIDNKHTPEYETIEDILHAALEQTLQTYQHLAAQHNRDSLLYGDIHQLELFHPFGLFEPLQPLVNLGPYPVGGDNTTINHQQWSFLSPFVPIIGPSMRFLTDLQSPFWWCILPGGQSGHPLHRHYSDQIQQWIFGQLHQIPFTTSATSLTATYALLLCPDVRQSE